MPGRHRNRMSPSGLTCLKSPWLLAQLLISFVPALHGQPSSPYAHAAADPAHHLTTREFFRDIGGDFVGLISTHSVVTLLAGGAAIGIATAPEQRLERHFASGDRWDAWADPGKYVGNPLILAGVSASLFGISRKSDDRKFRSLSYALVHGSITDAAITQSLKAAFHRLRPNGEDHMAFPSGHAVDSFMYATVFTEHYGWKAAIIGYPLATYVAATRLEDRKHHLTDVVAGSAIGFLVGRTVSRRMLSHKPSRFSWAAYPSGVGVTGSIHIALP